MGVLFDQMHKEIVNGIKAFFIEAGQPKVFHTLHAGLFNEDDIVSLATRTPQILTVFSGFDGEDSQTLLFTSFAMDQVTNKDKNGVLLLVNILSAALKQLDFEWLDDGPKGIRGRNLYSGKLKREKVSLWAVSWKIEISGADENGVALFRDLPMIEIYEGTLKHGDDEITDSFEGGE